MVNYSVLALSLFLACLTSNATADTAKENIDALNASVLRVHVNLPNGKHGLGSAVVVAKNQVVTSCHVVNEAKDVSVMVNGVSYVASAIKPDWRHDICILTVDNLNVPEVKLGASNELHYEDPLFTVGYPDEVKSPVNTYGVVKGLFPMDDSVIIRATSTFRKGANGGGAFDTAGNLIGIITVKSRGDEAYYYYVPVEWVKMLLKKPTQVLGLKSEAPFWANAPTQRPYFMQVTYPYLNQDWKDLLKVATKWVDAEPNNAESWFYLALAEYAVKDYPKAKEHIVKVLSLDNTHKEAISYLDKLTNQTLARQNYTINLAFLN